MGPFSCLSISPSVNVCVHAFFYSPWLFPSIRVQKAHVIHGGRACGRAVRVASVFNLDPALRVSQPPPFLLPQDRSFVLAMAVATNIAPSGALPPPPPSNGSATQNTASSKVPSG